MNLQSLQAALRHTLPEGRILTDEPALSAFGQDWSAFAAPRPAAVALPQSVEELRSLVAFARRHRVGLVPSGGRTGLSGGAVAAAGEIVVSLRDLNRVLELDPVSRTLRVEAGAVTRAVQEAAAGAGLYYPVEFAASGSSQIGGNVATNAGGLQVIRYGPTRDWVAGLKVVTGCGEVLDLNRGLVKNASGYDLRHLFVGSEGTLGLIAEVTLRLTAPPGPRRALLLAVDELASLPELLGRFREALVLNAFEFFCDAALGAVVEARGLARPFAGAAPWYALVDFDLGAANAGDAAGLEGEAMAVALGIAGRAVAAGLAADAVVAQDDADTRRLWRLREGISEAIASRHPYKNDLSVTVSRLPGFLAELERVIRAGYPDLEVVWFGHLGDGNLHLNVLRPPGISAIAFRERCEAVNDAVFAVVDRFEGSVSAEHGVGLFKKKYLHHSRSAAEIAAMRGIKAVFDPDGILNPGKLIDPL
jgi:FAD/FMN-containing dehydrogenase